MTRVALLSQPLTEVIGTAVAVIILWIRAQEALRPNPTFNGEMLITFMIPVMRLLPPFKALSQTPTTAQQSLAAAERLFEVLDRPTETQNDRGTRVIERFERAVEFQNVSFAYDTEPVLDDISFVAPKGVTSPS